MNKNTFPKYIDGRISTGRLTIDLQAVVDNYHILQKLVGSKILAPAVKANAYGLGIEGVVDALSREGCGHFFVSHLNEGFRVKKQNPTAKTFVLNGLIESALPSYAEADLIPVLSSMHDVKLWSEFWKTRSSRRPCAIHVDTGMNRLGLSLDELDALVEDEALSQSITPIMIMSHLACADEPAHPLNEKQLQRFEKASKHFPKADKSFVNSAGIFLGEDYHFDIARTGIALYGGNNDCNANGQMKPVVGLDVRVLQIRTLKKGDSVGYGATFTADEDMRIAILGTGYGDGYPRSTSSTGVAMRETRSSAGYGFLWGEKLPIIGRNSMDVLAVDVSHLDSDRLNEAIERDDLWVELLGENVPLDDVAAASGTIGYEILTQLGDRYSRYYRKSEKQKNEG